MTLFLRSIALLAAITFSAASLNAQRHFPISDDTGFLVNTMLEYDGQLLIGGRAGQFLGEEFNGLIAWDGGSNFEVIAPDSTLTANITIEDLALFNGGVAISYRNSSADEGVGFWDGTNFTKLGANFDEYPKELEVHFGQLYAGGSFDDIGGDETIAKLAVWNGAEWEAEGDFDDDVQALYSLDNKLYIGGDFDSISGAPFGKVAYLEYEEFNNMNGGFDDDVDVISEDPSGMLFGGRFEENIDESVELLGLARWNGTSFEAVAEFDFGRPEYILPYVEELGTLICARNGTVYSTYSIDTNGNLGTLYTFDSDGSVELTGALRFQGVDYRSFFGGFESYSTVPEAFGVARVESGGFCRSVTGAGSTIWGCADSDLNTHVNRAIPAWEVPAGSGVKPLYISSFFAIARTEEGSRYSLTNYANPGNQTPTSFRPGPHAYDYSSMEYMIEYTRAWAISRADIDTHLANFDQAGYEAPLDLLDWPTEGNGSNGETALLHGYDNMNGQPGYQPQDGDVPIIIGDHSVVSIKSDGQLADDLDDVGAEVLSSISLFDSEEGDAMYQSVFQRKVFRNKSGIVLDTLYVGMLQDFDLGGFEDDMIGTDLTNNMTYVYNADNEDIGQAGVAGYNENPPAAGIISFSAPIAASIAQTSLSLSSPLFYEQGLSGTYNNGTPQVDDQGQPSLYAYTGDPNDATTWSEISEGNQGDDQRLMTFYGPFLNVQPGQSLCLDFAYVYAREEGADHLGNVTALKTKAQAVHEWYDEQDFDCEGSFISSVSENSVPSSLNAFPNPASSVLTLTSSTSSIEGVTIYDLNGREMYTAQCTPAATIELDIVTLAKGYYTMRVQTTEGTISRSLIKE